MLRNMRASQSDKRMNNHLHPFSTKQYLCLAENNKPYLITKLCQITYLKIWHAELITQVITPSDVMRGSNATRAIVTEERHIDQYKLSTAKPFQPHSSLLKVQNQSTNRSNIIRISYSYKNNFNVSKKVVYRQNVIYSGFSFLAFVL